MSTRPIALLLCAIACASAFRAREVPTVDLDPDQATAPHAERATTQEALLPISVYKAASSNNVVVVVEWLDAGGNVNAVYTWHDEDAKPQTVGLLHVAAHFGHLDFARELLQRGALVDMTNNFGYSPLMMASEHGHAGVVHILLAHSANPDLQTIDGATALQAASHYGHEECVQALLEANAHTEMPDKAGTTALALAERAGHKTIVALIKKGKTLVYKYPSQYPADYIGWAKLPNPSKKPVKVPKGFRPEDYCDVCCRVAQGLEGPLQELLSDTLSKERAKRSKSAQNVGLLDELAQDGVETGCQFGPIWHDKTSKKICQHLVENYADQLSSAMVDFVTTEPNKTSARLRSTLCWHAVRVCEADAAERWAPPQPKTTLNSERPLAEHFNRGPVFKAVGANVEEHLAETEQDVVIFVYFGESAMHERLSPQYERVAEILAPHLPDSLRFISIDAARNDLPPSYGLHQITTETISVYSATEKMSPTLLNVPEDDTLVLNDYLTFLMSGCRHKDSLAHVRALGHRIPEAMRYDASWLSRSSRKRLDKELRNRKSAGKNPDEL